MTGRQGRRACRFQDLLIMTAHNSPAVLVVDDSHSTTMIIREFLRQMGHDNVDEAHDGETALQWARAKKYTWIISDLHMQPMNGMELLRTLRAELGVRTPQFIFVTGENKWSSQTTARDLGAHAFIQKPQRTMALKARIEAIFGPGGLAAAPGKSGEPEASPGQSQARKPRHVGHLLR
jgi:two-component system, chemotaxis family, chemotaxis protein CheY